MEHIILILEWLHALTVQRDIIEIVHKTLQLKLHDLLVLIVQLELQEQLINMSDQQELIAQIQNFQRLLIVLLVILVNIVLLAQLLYQEIEMLDMFDQEVLQLVIQVIHSALYMEILISISQQNVLKVIDVQQEATIQFLEKMEHTKIQKLNLFVNLVLLDITEMLQQLLLQIFQQNFEQQDIFDQEELKFLSQLKLFIVEVYALQESIVQLVQLLN